MSSKVEKSDLEGISLIPFLLRLYFTISLLFILVLQGRFIVTTYLGEGEFERTVVICISVVAAVLTLLSPAIAVLTSLVFAVVLSLSFIEYGMFHALASYIPFSIVSIFWALKMAIQKDFLQSKMLFVLDCLIILSSIAYFSTALYPSITNGVWMLVTAPADHLETEYFGLSSGMCWLNGLIGIRILSTENIKNPNLASAYRKFFVLIALLLIVLSILQIFFNFGTYYNQGLTVPFFGLHDYASIISVLSLWFFGNIFLSARTHRLFFGLLTSFLLALLILSTSRTGILLTVLCILIILYAYNPFANLKSKAVSKTILVFSILILFSLVAVSIFYSTISRNQSSITARINVSDPSSMIETITHSSKIRADLWIESMRVVFENPIAGIGFSRLLPSASPEYFEKNYELFSQNLFIWDSHNLFINIALCLGLLGLFLFLIFLYPFLRYSVSSIFARNVNLTAVASLCALLYLGNNMTNITLSWPFSFLLASPFFAFVYTNSQNFSTLESYISQACLFICAALPVVFLAFSLLKVVNISNSNSFNTSFGMLNKAYKFEATSDTFSTLPTVYFSPRDLNNIQKITVAPTPYLAWQKPLTIRIFQGENELLRKQLSNHETLEINLSDFAIDKSKGLLIISEPPWYAFPLQQWYQPSSLLLKIELFNIIPF